MTCRELAPIECPENTPPRRCGGSHRSGNGISGGFSFPPPHNICRSRPRPAPGVKGGTTRGSPVCLRVWTMMKSSFARRPRKRLDQASTTFEGIFQRDPAPGRLP